MKIWQQIIAGTLDKLIIVFALFLVALSTGNPSALDFWLILLVVFVSYLGIMIFVNLATMGVVTRDGFTRFALGVLVAGFVMWLYPMILEILFFVLGLEIAGDVRTVLLVTIVIRSFLRFFLAQRWNGGSE